MTQQGSQKKVLLIFGTRPEAIKMAPLVKALQEESVCFDTKVCLTGQHKEMLTPVMQFFGIQADYSLDVMTGNQSLYDLTAAIITALKPVLLDFRPDYVFVHGDTTTTMAASIASFYSGAVVCHVEAGLRTHNKLSPFPEEINRQLTSRIAGIHFAPTAKARENLLQENIRPNDIVVTGNTVIDALFWGIAHLENHQLSPELEKIRDLIAEKDVVLVTGHRRENHGKGIIEICEALKKTAEIDNTLIIYPVHLNPNIQQPVYESLSGFNNILLISPLNYGDFLWLMNQSKLIITDSGGIQEEAPSLGKPVLVMRDTTERPEAVEAGTVKLVGTNQSLIYNEAHALLCDEQYYQKFSARTNPYGDGTACKIIVNHLKSLHCNGR